MARGAGPEGHKYVCCVAGDFSWYDYRTIFRSGPASLTLGVVVPDAVFDDTGKDIGIYIKVGSTSSGCCRNKDPMAGRRLGGMLNDLSYNINEYVGE